MNNNPLFSFSLQEALSPGVFTGLIIGLTILFPALIYAKSMFKQPLWLYEEEDVIENITIVKNNWKKVNNISLLIAIVLGVISFFVLGDSVSPYIAPVIAIIVYLNGISILTDPNVRLVDRWILRMGTLFALIVGYLELASNGVMAEFIALALILAILSVFYFLPGIGASDARAFILVALAVFPFFYGPGVMLSILGMIICVFIYGIKQNGLNLKMFTTKFSTPLVPLLLTPTLIVLLVMGFIV